MKNFILIIFSILFLYSCDIDDFLSEVPRKEVSPANSFRTANDAELAIVGCYEQTLNNGEYLFGRRGHYYTTDEQYLNNVSNYLVTPSNSHNQTYWQTLWEAISACNMALDNIPGIEMDAERKNELLSEALFLRSFAYFHLVKKYRNIPMILKSTTSLADVNVYQVPPDSIFNQIIRDVEFAEQNLDRQSEKSFGRVTKGAAQVLLASIHLTRGSIIKRDNRGDGREEYEKAAFYAKKIIDSGDYSLVPYFPDVFTEENEGNSEIIFSTRKTGGGIGQGTALGWSVGIVGPGTTIGGSDGHVRGTYYYNTIFEKTDTVRRNWTMVHVTYNSKTKKLKWENDNSTAPWSLGKFRNWPTPPNYNRSDHGNDWPHFRYAEVLLIYAEALNEINHGPTAEVFQVLNQLRARARNTSGSILENVQPRHITYNPHHVPDISINDYPDYEAMFNYILYERSRELGWEGKRWDDLTRWGLLRKRMEFLLTDDGLDTPFQTFPEWHPNFKLAYDAEREVWPIPETELMTNPNIIQNPEWLQ